MRSYPHPTVQDLHGLRREVHIHCPMHQRIRNAVVVPLRFDVIVDINAGRLPLTELVTRSPFRTTTVKLIGFRSEH